MLGMLCWVLCAVSDCVCPRKNVTNVHAEPRGVVPLDLHVHEKACNPKQLIIKIKESG